MYFRRRSKDEDEQHRILRADEFAAAILSWLVFVAAAFVIILVDTWLGIALVAVAAVTYFVVSFLHIDASRHRVAAQLSEFERRKRNQGP